MKKVLLSVVSTLMLEAYSFVPMIPHAVLADDDSHSDVIAEDGEDEKVTPDDFFADWGDADLKEVKVYDKDVKVYDGEDDKVTTDGFFDIEWPTLPTNIFTGWTPLSFSLSPQIEIPWWTEDVRGVQVGLGNRSVDLIGLQLGLLNGVDDIRGIQAGIYNSANSAGGIEIGLSVDVNSASGILIGGISSVHVKAIGCQIGFSNVADSVVGCQVGVVNYARRLCGCQVGIINVAMNSSVLVMPFVNWCF